MNTHIIENNYLLMLSSYSHTNAVYGRKECNNVIIIVIYDHTQFKVISKSILRKLFLAF